jgi:hypothetical protein
VYREGQQFIVGQDIHYRNVHLFTDAINANVGNVDARKRKVSRDMIQLLKGAALQWWMAQLSPEERARISQGMDEGSITRSVLSERNSPCPQHL